MVLGGLKENTELKYFLNVPFWKYSVNFYLREIKKQFGNTILKNSKFKWTAVPNSQIKKEGKREKIGERGRRRGEEKRNRGRKREGKEKKKKREERKEEGRKGGRERQYVLAVKKVKSHGIELEFLIWA